MLTIRLGPLLITLRSLQEKMSCTRRLKADGLVSTLHRNSTIRRLQLWLQCATHRGCMTSTLSHSTEDTPMMNGKPSYMWRWKTCEMRTVLIDQECFTRTWRSCTEPGHSVEKVPMGELSLSGEPECLSPYINYSTSVPVMQEVFPPYPPDSSPLLESQGPPARYH